MKAIRFIQSVLLMSVVTLGISCATAPKQADNSPRFNEAASANVVLQYNSWDYIFLTYPAYRESGYLRQVKREELGQVFKKMGVERNLAVVVLGWNYAPETMAKMVEEWKATLTSQGFHRIVCVRSSGGSEINGSVIIDDSLLPGDQQTRTAKL